MAVVCWLGTPELRSLERNDRIVIASPLIHMDAEKTLSDALSEFHEMIHWVWLAMDTMMGPTGSLVPGLGKSMMAGMGFVSYQQRDKFIPQNIRQTLEELANSPRLGP